MTNSKWLFVLALLVSQNVFAQLQTFNLPLVSNAVVSSFSSSGATTIATCNIANCGLSYLGAGTVINIGQGSNSLPNACQGPATLNSFSGNTATYTNNWGATCPSASGSWANIFGSYGNLITMTPGQAASGQYAYGFLDYDGHLIWGSVYGGINRSLVSIDTTGVVGMQNNTANASMYIDYNGNLCLGDHQIKYNCSSTAFNTNTGSGYAGQLNLYMGMVPSLPSSLNGSNNVFGNGGDGLIYLPFQFGAGGFVGSQTFSNFLSVPSSGYGKLTLYNVQAYLVCTSNCSNHQTVYLALTNSDDTTGPRTFYSCGTQGGSGNMGAICTSAPTTAWDLTGSTALAVTFGPILVQGSATLTLNVVTTAGSGSQPTYSLEWNAEIH